MDGASEGRGRRKVKTYLAHELDLPVDVLDDGLLLQDGLLHNLGPFDDLCGGGARRAEVNSMVSPGTISAICGLSLNSWVLA
jgi:hypothetical protein